MVDELADLMPQGPPPCPEKPSMLGIETHDGKDKWWDGQREVIDLIVSAFVSHKYVLANIPTGGGKTIVATAVQKLMEVRSAALTHTIQLQKQYQETMQNATIATGKSNYPCGRSTDDPLIKLFGNMTAEDCDEYAGGCSAKDECDYYCMVADAARNPCVIMNYAYALRIIRPETISGLKNPFRRQFLIADEGHLAEDAIIDASAISIWNSIVEEAGLEPLPVSDNPFDWIAWATDNQATASRYNHDKESQVNDAEHTGGESLRNAYRGAKRARNLVATIGQLKNLKAADWAVSRGIRETQIRPLWAWTVAERNLFRHYDRVLIMSATLGNPDILMPKLGIDPGNAIYIDVPSTFPIANRPVFIWPVSRMNKNSTPDDWAMMASAIEHIVNMPSLKNEKGIIHTASYDIVNKLMQFLHKDNRYLFHINPKDKESLISILKDEQKPGIIVVSPSLATGVDISVIRLNIIAKVPYGNLGDPITRLRREYSLPNDPGFGKRNYDEEAMNTVVQAAGRAVRSPTDVGVTYILDGNFWMLYKRTHSPRFFQEAIKWLKT